MTENRVRVDHQKALAQAGKLREWAEEMRAARSRYNEALASLETAWTGAEAQQYLAKARRELPKMDRHAKHIDELAQAITRIANVYRQLELAKIRAQRTRS